MLESLTNFSFSTAQCWRNLNSHWLLPTLGRKPMFFIFHKLLLESVTWLICWVGQLIPCSSLSGFAGPFSSLKKDITVKCLLRLSSLCASLSSIMMVGFNLLYGLQVVIFFQSWMVSSYTLHWSFNTVGFPSASLFNKENWVFKMQFLQSALTWLSINFKCLTEYCAHQKTGNQDHRIQNWVHVCVCACWSRK